MKKIVVLFGVILSIILGGFLYMYSSKENFSSLVMLMPESARESYLKYVLSTGVFQASCRLKL